MSIISFDLLLLDIEMPSNGFQLAQSLIQMEMADFTGVLKLITPVKP